MDGPTDGDLVLCGSAESGFCIVDAVTGEILAGPIALAGAVEVALTRAPGDLWHQAVDERGQPSGTPVLMLRRR